MTVISDHQLMTQYLIILSNILQHWLYMYMYI